MGEDLISVLVPMYNVERYIERTVRSILRQTYRNFHLVLLDDGSTDGTYNVAARLAASDERIHLFRKENEKNISKTRNALLSFAKGKYAVFVDSDDVLFPRYLEKLHAALVESDADLSMCEFLVQKHPFSPIAPVKSRRCVVEGDDIFPTLVLNARFMLWNKMYKTDLLCRVRFDESVRTGEDFLFCLQYLKECRKIVLINDPLYHYLLRGGSEIHQKFSEREMTFVRALENYAEREEHPAARDAIRAWLSFSCGMYAAIAPRRKYKKEIAEMRAVARQYEKYMLKEKHTKYIFKFLLKISLFVPPTK